MQQIKAVNVSQYSRNKQGMLCVWLCFLEGLFDIEEMVVKTVTMWYF